MSGRLRRAAPWAAGLALLACVAALYALYHRRNWSTLVSVAGMLRSWWNALRFAAGL